MRSSALFFLLTGLAASAPTPQDATESQSDSATSTSIAAPAWTSWQPEMGAQASPEDNTASEVTAEQRMSDIQANYTTTTKARLQTLGDECTESNAIVRKEWGTLSDDQKLAYIEAVRCMAALPPKTSEDFAPGASSRYDDFSVAHILNAREVHFSAWLLPWHRHFIWSMEQALRDECGYDQALPYWDWSKYADLPLDQNPVFDGSATSLSGNGVTQADNPNCTQVIDGPLANWTVHLGPVAGLDPSCNTNPQTDGLGYNPRPLERSIRQENIEQLRTLNSYQNISDVILNYGDQTALNLRMDNGTLGIHGPPHLFIGGLNADTYASSGDPAFYLHHCMLDRVWSLWQSVDYDNRESDVGYTDGYDASIREPVLGWGPAPVIDIDSTLYLSPWFQNTTARESMSTMKNGKCYIYE